MIFKNLSKTHFAIYWWLFQVVTVLSLASVVIWLSLIPRNPIFAITDVSIPALGSHNSTLRHDDIVRNSSLVFNLEISNPNKGFGIYYDDIYMGLYYNEVVVGTKSTPAFYQGRKKTIMREVLINGDQQIWRGISSGNMDLRMALETAVKYRIFRWKTKHRRFSFEGQMTIAPNGNVTEKNIKLHLRH